MLSNLHGRGVDAFFIWTKVTKLDVQMLLCYGAVVGIMIELIVVVIISLVEILTFFLDFRQANGWL